jgi:carbonic anhydrase
MAKRFVRLLCMLLWVCGYAQAQEQESQSDSGIKRSLNYAQKHEDFRTLFFKEHEQEFVRLVKEGQSPKTLFIGCSDSRVIPELILMMHPGDLFVIRTAGNFVPSNESGISDGVSATVQYAVEYLGVKDIIVCGHSHCGAVAGLFAEKLPPELDILARWLRFGEQAKKMTLVTLGPNVSAEERNAVAERISVLYQLEHLLSFPSIKKRVEDKTLALHGWHFTIETGAIEYYDPQTYQFMPLNKSQ